MDQELDHQMLVLWLELSSEVKKFATDRKTPFLSVEPWNCNSAEVKSVWGKQKPYAAASSRSRRTSPCRSNSTASSRERRRHASRCSRERCDCRCRRPADAGAGRRARQASPLQGVGCRRGETCLALAVCRVTRRVSALSASAPA